MVVWWPAIGIDDDREVVENGRGGEGGEAFLGCELEATDLSRLTGSEDYARRVSALQTAWGCQVSDDN
jgi:hypothetical protein